MKSYSHLGSSLSRITSSCLVEGQRFVKMILFFTDNMKLGGDLRALCTLQRVLHVTKEKCVSNLVLLHVHALVYESHEGALNQTPSSSLLPPLTLDETTDPVPSFVQAYSRSHMNRINIFPFIICLPAFSLLYIFFL